MIAAVQVLKSTTVFLHASCVCVRVHVCMCACVCVLVLQCILAQLSYYLAHI